MSLLSVMPDIVAAASANLESLGSALRSANTVAARQTTAIAAPAADEVSAAVTSIFGAHAQEFQTLSAKAAAFHDEFVNLLMRGAAQYVSTEVANAQQTLVNSVNTPAQALLGHNLIGTSVGHGSAAANPASTISFNTPFGTFVVSSNGNNISYLLYTAIGPEGLSVTPTGVALGTGTDGPVGGVTKVLLPFGNSELMINGDASSGGAVVNYSSGTLTVPAAISLLAALAGPDVTGTASLASSYHAFTSALGSGHPLAAIGAFLYAPANFADAVLFGHQTITGALSGQGLDFTIPFGGIFAPLEPATLTVQPQTFSAAGTPYTQHAAHFALRGTEFGGIVPELLNSFVRFVDAANRL
jgi:PE family